MGIQAILFDMDDTLLDWSQITEDWDTFNRTHLHYVFDYIASLHPLNDSERFITIVNQLTMEHWHNARNTLDAPHIEKVLLESCLQMGIPRELLNSEQLIMAYDWQPFPGLCAFPDVQEVLPELYQSGLKLGIITNAFQPMLLRDRELDTFGLLPYFSNCRFSAADVGYLKPHPAIFEAALQCLNLAPENVVFIGDSTHADIAGARSAGIKAILRVSPATMMFQNPDIEPDATIHSFHELYAILDEWDQNWRQISSQD